MIKKTVLENESANATGYRSVWSRMWPLPGRQKIRLIVMIWIGLLQKFVRFVGQASSAIILREVSSRPSAPRNVKVTFTLRGAGSIPGSAKGTGLRAPASSLPHFQSVRKRPKGSLGERVKDYEIWLPTSLALPLTDPYPRRRGACSVERGPPRDVLLDALAWASQIIRYTITSEHTPNTQYNDGAGQKLSGPIRGDSHALDD
ncbi:hypothetical protein C8R48DRAFT_762675 [Suillus tomentosus]|nr:hypothetical protein C8R48DRAFT_762675 [Suillus tomentosus]